MSDRVRNFLVDAVVMALALALTAWIVPGIQASGPLALFIAAVVFGLINAFVRPIATLISLPFIVLTLGLFYLVLNALLLQLTAFLAGPGFTVDGFFPTALIGAVVLAIIGAILGFLLPEERLKRPTT